MIYNTIGSIHIHKLRRQARGEGEGGLAICLALYALYYYISLCSKIAYGGGEGVKNWQILAYVVYGCPHTKGNTDWLIFIIFSL